MQTINSPYILLSYPLYCLANTFQFERRTLPESHHAADSLCIIVTAGEISGLKRSL
jgi:hypothetical protein